MLFAGDNAIGEQTTVTPNSGSDNATALLSVALSPDVILESFFIVNDEAVPFSVPNGLCLAVPEI